MCRTRSRTPCSRFPAFISPSRSSVNSKPWSSRSAPPIAWRARLTSSCVPTTTPWPTPTSTAPATSCSGLTRVQIAARGSVLSRRSRGGTPAGGSHRPPRSRPAFLAPGGTTLLLTASEVWRSKSTWQPSTQLGAAPPMSWPPVRLVTAHMPWRARTRSTGCKACSRISAPFAITPTLSTSRM